MKHHPFVYTFRDLIAGNGFLACVSIRGTALLVVEDDGDVWLQGVQPGSVSGGAQTMGAAFAEFKHSYLSALYDAASDATSFDEFKSRTEAFLDEMSRPYLTDWREALDDASRTRIVSVGVTRSTLRRMLEAEIVQVTPETATSAMNTFDAFAEVSPD